MKSNTKYWISSITLVMMIAVFIGTMAFLFWAGLTPQEQDIIIKTIKPEYYFILFGPPLVIIGLYLSSIFTSWIQPLGKLSEETTLIHSANPSHRVQISGSQTVRQIAKLINKGADIFEALDENVKEKIETAGKRIEEEKNILAAFISELSKGVLICRHDGSILLFNKKAKEFLSEAPSDDNKTSSYIGLGRSVFTLIDKNIVVHALNTINSKLSTHSENSVATFVIVGKNHTQFKVEAVPILDSHRVMTGFIFIMTDITTQLITDKKADIMLQNLTKNIRSSLGGIRAAVETIIDFPDMEKEQRDVFNQIILKESKSLGDTIDQNQKDYSAHLHSKWPLVHINGDDLASAFKLKAEEKLGLNIKIEASKEDLWIRADSYSLTTAMLFLAARIKETKGTENLIFKTDIDGKFVHIDFIWEGDPLKIEALKGWSEMVLMVENEGIPLTLKEVAGHHDAEILPHSTPENKHLSSVKLFLPSVETPSSTSIPQTAASIVPVQRPEFYDFDLFDQETHSTEYDNVPLKDLTYTVFDTETTGLNPSGGDEIISIGAVRIVNLKLLSEDIFEHLIDPKRSLPASSIKIHGIEPEMLEGQPDITKILPRFLDFTAETVLVGHNVAFDMAMLKAKEDSTGITFTHPVLDTLLLSAVVNPEQDSHNIEAITKRLGINVIGRHTAVGDAITTAEMFLKIIHLLSEKGIYTLRDAVEASKKTYYARLKY